MNAAELQFGAGARRNVHQFVQQPTDVEEMAKPPDDLRIVDVLIQLHGEGAGANRARIVAEFEPGELFLPSGESMEAARVPHSLPCCRYSEAFFIRG